jgi:DNA (cytosine-5)-methyltransferase 1
MGYSKTYARKMGLRGGFPQVVSDTQSYRQFGNSVVPPVVDAIGKEIVKVLKARHERSVPEGIAPQS